MTAPQQEAEAVEAWMTAKGYKYYNDTLGTYGYAKVGMPPVEVETATFFYRASKQAELEAACGELEKLSRKLNQSLAENQPVLNMIRDQLAELHRLQKGDV